jgi:hypothetical protein
MPVQAQAARDTTDATCDVCAHDLDAHDAIGRRFCQATLDGALTRGCACRPEAARG